MTESARLAELSLAIRESTLERLRRVPAGRENWRASPGSLSFADIAHHLLAADDWLERKLADPSLTRMVARAGEAGEADTEGHRGLLERLARSGETRAARLAGLRQPELERLVRDDRFDGPVTVWWVIVRGNLDHEAHHRGQLAAYLRLLEEH